MIESLEKYTTLGIKCLPVQKNKSPLKGYMWKTPNIDKSAFVGAFGIAMACGSESGGLECLDIDNHSGDAKDNLSNFISDIKDIYNKYKFPIESTMSGGFHIIYRCEEIEGNQKLAQRPLWNERAGKFKPDAIIETRGEGGYFVCAPSPGYKFIRGDINKIPVVSIKDRERMFEVAKSYNTWFKQQKHKQEENSRPGDTFNSSPEAPHRAKQALRDSGWTEVGSGTWRRPDKKDGISATFGKAAENIFYCFSTNGHPFDSNSGYTPFQVVALLEYDGDFSSFAKDLVAASPKETFVAKEKKDDNQMESILKKAYIDLRFPVAKPPLAMTIRQKQGMNFYDNRLFTLGNFSAITGKSKSKKTFLTTLLLAAASSGGTVKNKITGHLPENKSGVMLFDTEQSNYDAFIASNRVLKTCDVDATQLKNFAPFDLREYSPIERCNIIEYGIKKFKGSIGYIVIDGIADLAKANNDEEEATRVVSLLMRWTKQYNCHITTIIHQNKNNEHATGHLGSFILKKAECVIAVQKDENDFRRSTVECQLIRGAADFNNFEIEIDENGLPQILEIDETSIYRTNRDLF